MLLSSSSSTSGRAPCSSSGSSRHRPQVAPAPERVRAPGVKVPPVAARGPAPARSSYDGGVDVPPPPPAGYNNSQQQQAAAAAAGPEHRVVVVTSGKGGVGKTTTTANLGMSIARLGYKVALLDADIGLRNLDLLLGLENRVLYTAIDILEGECRLDQALIRDKRWKNLALLSVSRNRQRYNITRRHMEQLVQSILALGYHFVLIDCPAGIDVGFINAISPAREALVVTTPEITSIRDADRVAGLLEANGIYNTKLLVNRVRPDMIQRNDMMSVRDVQEMLGIPLLGAVPEDTQVIVSTNRGEPLVLQKKLTLSGIAFENAARRLIGRQDYFVGGGGGQQAGGQAGAAGGGRGGGGGNMFSRVFGGLGL